MNYSVLGSAVLQVGHSQKMNDYTKINDLTQILEK